MAIEDRIRNRFDLLGKTVLDIVDSSKGVDQAVYIVTCADGTFVYKEPKREMDKIQNEVTGCELAAKLGIPAPTVIVYTDDYLIQTCVKGKTLLETGTSVAIHTELGQYLRKLHSVSATYWGEIGWKTGKTHASYIHEFLDAKLDKLLEKDWFTSEEKSQITQYFTDGEKYFSTGTPVYCHGDPYDDNILGLDGALSGVIDWADLCGGVPEEDFACIYQEHQDNEYFQAAVSAHGNIDVAKAKFFCAIRLTWQIDESRPADPIMKGKIALFRDIIGLK